MPCSSLRIPRRIPSSPCFAMICLRALVLSSVQQSNFWTLPEFIPALMTSSFRPTIRSRPHNRAYSSRNRYILGNLKLVSMWITGNGISPRNALRHSQSIVVESLPIDQSMAIFRNRKYASLMMYRLLFSSAERWSIVSSAGEVIQDAPGHVLDVQPPPPGQCGGEDTVGIVAGVHPREALHPHDLGLAQRPLHVVPVAGDQDQVRSPVLQGSRVKGVVVPHFADDPVPVPVLEGQDPGADRLHHLLPVVGPYGPAGVLPLHVDVDPAGIQGEGPGPVVDLVEIRPARIRLQVPFPFEPLVHVD